MNKLKIVIAAAGALMFAQLAAQDNNKECSSGFWAYQEFSRKDQFVEAYPKWKETFDMGCEDFQYFPNILTDGETILNGIVSTGVSKQDSMKYGRDIVAILQKRQSYQPEQLLFWKGDEINTKVTYGLITQEQAYSQYQDLFKKVKEKDGELSAGAVTGYFSAAAALYGEQKIEFKEFMQVYSDDIKVIKRNAEIRDLRFNELKLKQDSAKLDREEVQQMEEAKTFAEYFKGIENSVAYSMQDFVKCENLGPLYFEDLEAKKDSMDWLNTVVYTLDNIVEGGCADVDSVYYPKLAQARVDLYCKQNPEACKQQEAEDPVAVVTRDELTLGNSEASDAIEDYKKGNYRGAISKLKNVVNSSTGPNKGTYAYYLADSYAKSGNNPNAIIWYNKAAQYKPGWGAPYTGIARIFGDKNTINSCGNNNTQKSAAYLVAADYMKKACRYDKSACKYVGQYERVGPTKTDMFNDGYNVGQRISIRCHGGASTTLR